METNYAANELPYELTDEDESNILGENALCEEGPLRLNGYAAGARGLLTKD